MPRKGHTEERPDSGGFRADRRGAAADSISDNRRTDSGHAAVTGQPRPESAQTASLVQNERK
jgi:hypothetical protein